MRTNTARPTLRNTAALALSLALALGLSACGGNNDSTSNTNGTTSDASTTDHNDADVAFATGMIPHHQQALEMVKMTEGRPLDPEVKDLADSIEAAQAPEIDTMSGWLESWGEDVPDSSGMDHSDMNGGMSGDMSGMMSDGEMNKLDAASDDEFQQMWLTMMVKHHEGAVDMANTETDDGEYQPALDLAESIVTSQTAEIDTMKRLLAN